MFEWKDGSFVGALPWPQSQAAVRELASSEPPCLAASGRGEKAAKVRSKCPVSIWEGNEMDSRNVPRKPGLHRGSNEPSADRRSDFVSSAHHKPSCLCLRWVICDKLGFQIQHIKLTGHASRQAHKQAGQPVPQLSIRQDSKNVDPHIDQPQFINRGCPWVQWAKYLYWREPPTNKLGLIIMGQHLALVYLVDDSPTKPTKQKARLWPGEPQYGYGSYPKMVPLVLTHGHMTASELHDCKLRLLFCAACFFCFVNIR